MQELWDGMYYGMLSTAHLWNMCTEKLHIRQLFHNTCITLNHWEKFLKSNMILNLLDLGWKGCGKFTYRIQAQTQRLNKSELIMVTIICFSQWHKSEDVISGRVIVIILSMLKKSPLMTASPESEFNPSNYFGNDSETKVSQMWCRSCHGIELYHALLIRPTLLMLPI